MKTTQYKTYCVVYYDYSRSTQKVLYKAVFHGGMKSMWGSVMEEPKAREVVQCIDRHDTCVEHQILASHVNHFIWDIIYGKPSKRNNLEREIAPIFSDTPTIETVSKRLDIY